MLIVHARQRNLAVLAVLLLGGCEQTFEPILTPDDLHFSVYGFLDASASADTQWVRVGPIRRSVHSDPEGTDAVVMLENVDSGQVILLHDSLSTFRRDLGTELAVYNYWTTEKVEPGGTYRLSVTVPNGASASALVPIPRPFPAIVEVGITRANAPDYVRVEGVEHMAIVQVLHHIPEECVLGFSIFHSPFSIPDPPLEEGAQIVPIRHLPRLGDPDEDPVPCHLPVRKREIRLIASGSEWPFDPESTDGTLSHKNVISNVQNAVGFVGGVITLTVPYERDCMVPGSPVCWLRYGPESGIVRGILRDHACDGRPIGGPRPIITLRKLDTGMMRSTGTDGTGHYEFGAIESGRYELRASVTVPLFQEGYQPHVDTLDFEVGEVKVLDLPMRRVPPHCFD